MNAGISISRKDKCRRFFSPVFILLFLFALSANANPVITAAYSLLSFASIVTFILPCLFAEAVVVGSLLGFSGFSTKRTIAGYMLTNVGVYFLIFSPLQGLGHLPVIVSEGVATFADAACIKFLGAVEYFSEDRGESISWRRVLVIAAIGNAVSYSLPYLIT